MKELGKELDKKELDKAIMNSDVNRIIYLVSQGVDCEYAVLMHLKDQLVPAHFTEARLRARGAIMRVEDLNRAIERFTQGEPVVDIYRIDFYIKRLYSSAQQALKAWQTGCLKNQELEKTWDLEAVQYLIAQWIRNGLPTELQAHVQKAQDTYIEAQYQKWALQSGDSNTCKALDDRLLSVLHSQWHLRDERDSVVDPVCRQIHSILIDEAVELYRSDKDSAFAKDVVTFIRGKINKQIGEGCINKELIRSLLDEEKTRILKGDIAAAPVRYYEEAMVNLLTAWQSNRLIGQAENDMTGYIRKQLQDFELSGELKVALLKKAIPHLLILYRRKELPAEVMDRLLLQFKSNIVGYYEKNAAKDTPFRNELSQVIFSQLLLDWKKQQPNIDASMSQYLQLNLLSDLQRSLREFSSPTSRFTLHIKIMRLMDRVVQLEGELSALKASKESTPLAEVSDGKPKETEASQAIAAQQHGMFKPTQTSNSELSKDAAVIPKQQGPGPQ